jgi:hypothetical protein
MKPLYLLFLFAVGFACACILGLLLGGCTASVQPVRPVEYVPARILRERHPVIVREVPATRAPLFRMPHGHVVPGWGRRGVR